MKNLIVLIIAAMIFLGFNGIYAKDDVTINSLAPVVVKTFPVSGEYNVDPSITKIKVTFSKDMMTNKMWSWANVSKNSFPKINGDIKFENKRTCILPVSLEPNKTYAMWINNQKYNSFKDMKQNSAIPYLLVFKTGRFKVKK